MSLRTGDLGGTAYALNGFYATVSRGVAAYHAELASACRSSSLDGVQLDLILTQNATAGALTASANFRSLKRSLSPRTIVAGGGGSVTGAAVRPLSLAIAGARVRALEVSTTGPLGPGQAVVAVVDVGRVAAILSIGSRPGQRLDGGEPERLVRALVRRIAAELGRR